METNCDHIGPRPIGYCVDNKMTECVYNNHTNRWFIQIKQYDDTNCNGTIINKRRLQCFEDAHMHCQCGKGICPQNKIITIQQNNDDQSDNECVKTFKTIVFIKNHCIPGNLFQLTLDNNSVSSSIDSQHNDQEQSDKGELLLHHNYSSINRVMLKCDDKLQQLSYYEYNDNKCNGDPVLAEPQILIEFLDNPCINIHC